MAGLDFPGLDWIGLDAAIIVLGAAVAMSAALGLLFAGP